MILVVVLGCSLLSIAACTQVPIGVNGMELGADDQAVVIVQGRAPSLESAFDSAFVNCINKRLAKALPRPFTIYQTKEFQNSMFPWFEPEYAPQTTEELRELIARPEVNLRIHTLHVRFIVTVAGGTESNEFPRFFCTYGCFGVYASHNISHIAAIVFDIEGMGSVPEFKVESEGNTIIPMYILPIPLAIALTESEACDEVSNQIERHLIQNERGKSQ